MTTLGEYFAYLERRQGGSGNGISGYRRRTGIKTYKGVRKTPQALAETVMRWRDSGYIQFAFHTRMATSGYHSDTNCQPFQFSQHSALAHNGHDVDYHAHSSPVSDSYLIAYSVHQEYLTIPELRKRHGAFIGWTHGAPFAVNDGMHDMSFDLDGDTGAWCIASDIPSGMRQGAYYEAGKYLWIGYRPYVQGRKWESFPDVPTTKAWSYDNWGDWNYGRSATVYTPKTTAKKETWDTDGERFDMAAYYRSLSPEEQEQWDTWEAEQEDEWARSRLATWSQEGSK